MIALLQNWTVMRALRLIIGGGFFVMGIQEHDTLQSVVGGVFLIQALANIGCCGNGGCAVPTRFNVPSKSTGDRATYEEIK